MNDCLFNKKPKHNLLEIQSHYSNCLPLNTHSSDIQGIYGPNLSKHLAQRKNGIKINMNKFPSDFFTRIDEGIQKEGKINPKDFQNSQKKNKITSTHSFSKNKQQKQKEGQQFYGKAQSQRNHISPQKTSFFGFFYDKTQTNRKMTVRQYQKEGINKFHSKSKSMSQNKQIKNNGKASRHHQHQINRKFGANLIQDESDQRRKSENKMPIGNSNKFFNQQKLQQKLYKRNYQTRQVSKRQSIIKGQSLQQVHRHYTPVTIYNPQKEKQKSDLLELFPATHDKNTKELIINSNRGKTFKMINNPEKQAKQRNDQNYSLSWQQETGVNKKNHQIKKIGNTIERESQIKQKKSSTQTNSGKTEIEKRKKLGIRQKKLDMPLLSYRQFLIESKSIQISDPNNITFFVSGSKKEHNLFPHVSSKNTLHSQR